MTDSALLAAQLAGGAAYAARMTGGGRVSEGALPQYLDPTAVAQDEPAPHNLIQAAALFVAPGQGRD
jgi:hypothetical protein